ncbi:MAG: metallophosphoesterase family protein [Ardenticatenaceae bacterium]|nr:metallophosphoesterase family protein [Ardenticatenaceae bacterium]MCB9443383.1 metallophosphoesterase family protein [Ardenticatenaceae bacterium]
MKIGILSDTHNDLPMLQQALAFFQRQGIQTLIHCGNMTSPETAVYCQNFTFIYVHGNMDRSHMAIRQTLFDINPSNVAANQFTGELIPGVRVAVTHGHIPGKIESFIAKGYNYIFHGHTHRRRDEIIGGSRIINSGALGGAEHEPRSVCLLDLKTGYLQFINQSQW